MASVVTTEIVTWRDAIYLVNHASLSYKPVCLRIFMIIAICVCVLVCDASHACLSAAVLRRLLLLLLAVAYHLATSRAQPQHRDTPDLQ